MSSKYSVGRYLYGLAAVGFGICALVWHDVSTFQQFKSLGYPPQHEILAYIVAIVEIVGGAAILWPRTACTGAIALGTLYAIFAAMDVMFIIQQPLVYNGYGNFFEQFSFVAGALLIYAHSCPNPRLAQFGCYSFGICVISFALEQAFYIAPTASLVPAWIPPNQMFWAWATTIALALGAIAILTGFISRLASQLTTAMLLGFGLLVWLPAIVTAPHNFTNWSEGIETLGIAATAWLAAEYLSSQAVSSRA